MKCIWISSAFVMITGVCAAAQPPTELIFDTVTDTDGLSIGAEYYIVSYERVPYAANEGDIHEPQYLISSITNSGLVVRAIGEGRPQALTLSGYDASYCTLMHNGRFYMGYDKTTGRFGSYNMAEDDLTDSFYYSISVDRDGIASVSPYGSPEQHLCMIDESGADDDGASLYMFRMNGSDSPGAVGVMLATGYREVLSDIPEIDSPDGVTVSEPVIPDGFELLYRVRPYAMVFSLANDTEWKPWDRQSYYTDVYAIPTDDYYLDMKYSDGELESRVTTRRMNRAVLTGIDGVSARRCFVSHRGGYLYNSSDAAVEITVYDIYGHQVLTAAVEPGDKAVTHGLNHGIYVVYASSADGHRASTVMAVE